MLEPIAEGIWVAARPLRFVGVDVGTRMTVIRLDGGGVFVHSPVALDLPTRAAVDALGPVVAVVAPSLFHHVFVGEWAKAYPHASLSACPGLDAKRKDVLWTRVLDGAPAPDAEWRGELDQVFFTALPMQNEVVFFHRRSRTLVSSDVVFNLAHHRSAVTRAFALLMGQREPGPTVLERLLLRDRAAAREQIGRMVAWNPERIVLATATSCRRVGPRCSSAGTAGCSAAAPRLRCRTETRPATLFDDRAIIHAEASRRSRSHLRARAEKAPRSRRIRSSSCTAVPSRKKPAARARTTRRRSTGERCMSGSASAAIPPLRGATQP